MISKQKAESNISHWMFRINFFYEICASFSRSTFDMNRHIYILYTFSLIFLAGFVHAQEEKIIYVEHNTSSWGYKAELLMPSVRPGSENGPLYKGDSVTYDVNDHPGVKPGFAFGVFYETRLTNSFYLQMEVNYQWYQYRLDYVMNVKDGMKSKYDADYTMRSSSIFIPLLPKFRFGNKYKVYVMAGPYINVPFSPHTSGKIVIEQEEAAGKVTTSVIRDESINKKPEKLEYGLIGGIGVKVPLKADDLVIEMRYDGSLNDVVRDPDLRAQAFSLHLGLIKVLK